MRFQLVPNLLYEVLVQTAEEGNATSFFYASHNPLESREAALNRFMELTLSDEIKPDEIFVTVYARYIPTGGRAELVNSSNYQRPGANLKALEQEVYWYQKENIATHLGVYVHTKPKQIIILWPRFKNAHLIKNETTSVVLGQKYWIFLRKKREILRIA